MAVIQHVPSAAGALQSTQPARATGPLYNCCNSCGCTKCQTPKLHKILGFLNTSFLPDIPAQKPHFYFPLLFIVVFFPSFPKAPIRHQLSFFLFLPSANDCQNEEWQKHKQIRFAQIATKQSIALSPPQGLPQTQYKEQKPHQRR